MNGPEERAIDGSAGRDGPRARSEHLVIEELDGEVLVYDTERHHAHNLGGLAAAVWRACDGRRTPAEIAAVVAGSYPESDQASIADALRQLRARHLLSTPGVAATPTGASDDAGDADDAGARVADRMVSRRRALRRIGIGMAAGLAAPIIQSIVAPTPAHAFSCIPSGGSCSASAQCCSGVCVVGFCL